ncbi:MAG: alkaline phosphatase D family protein [Acidobacteriota bacterium]|nr:alkaline phosphatase D family protein [Acidobacteriota bacterium]
MRRISRRSFLATSSLALGALPAVRPVSLFAQLGRGVFRHGVASGDPLADRVIVWTRVTPTAPAGSMSVRWQVARDPRFTQIVSRGDTTTGAERDFTVKIDASGLQPGNTYYYRFESLGARSAIGRTRTLPREGVARLRLGVVSCSNLPQGYFNAYACLAKRADLDAVLHLGDYIYEYANARYGDGTALGRIPAPNREIVALQDYRERHAQYKADPDSQEIHRQHPFIVVWDDHEFTNNAWSGGAENHDPDEGEGEWGPRRAAAQQAYYEWMPIREDAQTRQSRIYRAFRFGDLATLMMLDTRVVGRDEQVRREDTATIESAARQLLGAEQEGWLAEQVVASVRNKTHWNLLGQQVMFAPQTASGAVAGNPDSWDGYRASRSRVFDMIERARAGNFAVLTGDVHSSWAYDLPRDPFAGYDKSSGKGSLGVEFAGTSVSSPSSIGAGPGGEQQLAGFRKARPHLHYVDGRYRGYFVLDLTRERLQADFYRVATILDRTTEEKFERGFVTASGANHLVPAATAALSATAPDPAP